MPKLTKWIAPLLPFLCAAALAAQPANWIQQSPQNSPPGRSHAAMAYDAERAQVVLYGGQDANFKSLTDTWVWDGVTWTQKSPQISPPLSANDYAMAYDSAHSQVVLFTLHLSASGGVWETWVWDGTNWNKKSPQTNPVAGSNPAMAYDSARHQVVLFLAADCIAIIADTWVWDGTNWTKKSPQTNPQPQVGASMAYDAAHGKAVLFGGGIGCPTLTASNFMYAWDGSNWTRQSPQNLPAARMGHALAYDSDQGRIVLFGGVGSDNNSPYLTDTSVWDGTNWTLTTPVAQPSGRNGPAMAYDAGHHQVLLFGGSNDQSIALSDTWIWNAAGTGAQPVINSVISASGFGGFPSVAPGSWVEIYGTNLASTTRGWTGTDFNGNDAPTSLDGVEVTAGGQKAFIDYIVSNPGQVNAQLPSNIATSGTLQLTVKNGSAVSAPYNITVKPVAPGLLAPASFNVGGKQYVVAQLSDGNYVLPAGAISGVGSRPAKPGETVVIYGIGFGDVTPNIAAGEIATVATQLTASLQISFGSAPAQLPYFGLAPNFVGLYQFNVTVPTVDANDLLPLTFNLNGTEGAQTLYTAVAAP